jgi:hypothetical protein
MSSDFEYVAARVVARFTGEAVTIQDDGSSPAMPDIRIDYADARVGYVEVWKDLDEPYAAMTRGISEHGFEISGGDLGRVWVLEVSGRFRTKDAGTTVPALLAALTAEGNTFSYGGVAEFLSEHPSAHVQTALRMGIVTLSSRPMNDGEESVIHLGPQGINGPANVTWEPFLGWIKETLSSDNRNMVGNRRKLAAAGGDERHAFLGVTFSSPWTVFDALSFHVHTLPWERSQLPSLPPELPAEITHLWLMNAQAPERCLAWYPDRGWFDPAMQWATE